MPILKYNNFLAESAIKKDKDTEIFNYSSLIKDAWFPKIKDSQKFQNVNFDLENNESTGEKKTIYIKKNLRKDQPVKYEFNCELYEAGGDWEAPVMYFKIEFTHDYSVISRDYFDKGEYIWDKEPEYGKPLSHSYVLIPGPEINHLTKSKKGYTAHTRDTIDDMNRNAKITDEDRKKAWKWIESELTKVVEERHKMLD